MNKGIKEEVDNITLNLLLARNLENSYYNNCLDLQKLNNLYTFPNNSLYGNLNTFQTGFNPSLVMANIQNLGNFNSLLFFSNPNQAANLANFCNYANFPNVAKLNNSVNNENSKLNSSNIPTNFMKINEEKAFSYNGQQTVMIYLLFDFL